MNPSPQLPTCSLLIATYNWPEALDLCLASIMHQHVLPSEILIADDGSSEATANLITQWQQKCPVPIQHVWHPDQGFRLSEIRNKAIKRANHPYIIQIDGDILVDPYFIGDHLKNAKEGFFLCGSRASLSSSVSKKLLASLPRMPKLTEVSPGYWFNCIRFPLLSKLISPFYNAHLINRLRGCNMSFWRKDLIRVNGYNQDMTGWGPEDKEIAVRLINSGVKKRNLKFLGVAYHLYHIESNKSNAASNWEFLKKAFENNHKWAENGINKLQ